MIIDMILKIVIAIAITAITTVISLFILNVINFVSQLILTSHAKQKAFEVTIQNKVKINVEKQLQNNDSLLKLIDYMIQDEVNLMIYKSALLKEKYNITRIDEDSKKISTTIVQAFNTEMMLSSDLSITSEYLCRYITKNTSFVLLASVNEYNQKISDQS